MSDVLAGFTPRHFRHDGTERTVYVAGTGPAVIVIHEMPGMHPGVIDFARRVIAAGLTTYLPNLFGTPGRPVSGGYMLKVGLRACVAREFTVFGTARTSPIVGWLRALAAQAHELLGSLALVSLASARGESADRASAPSGCASPAGSRSG